jgi:hypothetical protein
MPGLPPTRSIPARFPCSHIVLGARSIHRLTRRIHQLYLLDIQHVLPAVEGQGARSARPQARTHQLLSVGAVHTALAGAHVLLTVGRVALVQHQDGLRHRHARQVRQQHGALEPGRARQNLALLGQAHGQGARSTTRNHNGRVRPHDQAVKQVLLVLRVRPSPGQLPAHHVSVHQAALHR